MQYSEAVIPTKARPSVRGRVLSLGTFVATIKARIFIAFFVMSLLSGALGIYAIIAIDHVGDLVGKTYDQSLMSINYARATAADFAKMRAVFARQGLTSDKAAIAKLDAPSSNCTTLARRRPDHRRRARSVRSGRAGGPCGAGRRRSLGRYPPWLRGSLSTVRQDRWDALDHQADIVDAQLDMLVNYTAGDGFTFRQAARMAVNSELRLNMAAAALAIFGSALIAWLLHRRIRGPIVSASIAAERIAAGHLDDSIPTDGRDELSSLLRSMAAMRDNIRV